MILTESLKVQYQSQKPEKGLKPDIERRENWPLRGLFWVAKDLYDAALEFRDAMEPEAREIDITRNHAEHKYLRVHDDLWPELSAMANGPSSMPADASFSIGCDMLIQRTVRLTKLARSALMYLAFAVHAEEAEKQSKKRPGGQNPEPPDLLDGGSGQAGHEIPTGSAEYRQHRLTLRLRR